MSYQGRVWIDASEMEMEFTREGVKSKLAALQNNPNLIGVILSPKYAAGIGLVENRGLGIRVDKRLDGLILLGILRGDTQNTHFAALDKRGQATLKKLLKAPALFSQIIADFYDDLEVDA